MQKAGREEEDGIACSLHELRVYLGGVQPSSASHTAVSNRLCECWTPNKSKCARTNPRMHTHKLRIDCSLWAALCVSAVKSFSSWGFRLQQREQNSNASSKYVHLFLPDMSRFVISQSDDCLVSPAPLHSDYLTISYSFLKLQCMVRCLGINREGNDIFFENRKPGFSWRLLEKRREGSVMIYGYPDWRFS